MFVAQAHSFTQQARLAITLAWVAGYTNILTILTCGHVTSHVSGTTSDFGRGLAAMDLSLVGFTGFLLAAFLAGATLSGVCMEIARKRGWESVYVLPMAVEAALLLGVAIGVEVHDFNRIEAGGSLYVLTGLASLAMGLQNATITRISGGVVRTTHVTGVLTDLGLECARAAAAGMARLGSGGTMRSRAAAVREHPSTGRLLLLASIVGSFALGAGLGTLAFEYIQRLSMFPPVVFLIWIIYQDLRRPIAEIQAAEMQRNVDMGLPGSLGVFHVRPDRVRTRGIARLPNLGLWAEQLSAETRVAVLDLSMFGDLDDNAAMEISAAAQRLRSEGRQLILAGVNQAKYQRMAHALHDPSMKTLMVYDDLDLAIAHGLNEAQRRH